MYTKAELCNKIREMFPDVGECGTDIDVEYDSKQQAYTVGLRKNGTRLKTYLEPEDADICMAGRQCVGLGIQIAQLRGNIQML